MLTETRKELVSLDIGLDKKQVEAISVYVEDKCKTSFKRGKYLSAQYIEELQDRLEAVRTPKYIKY